MFRTIADFKRHWESESGFTLSIFKALTDASLSQAVTEASLQLEAAESASGHRGASDDRPARLAYRRNLAGDDETDRFKSNRTG